MTLPEADRMRLSHYELPGFIEAVPRFQDMFEERIARSRRQEIRSHNQAEFVKTDVEGLTTMDMFATYVHVASQAASGAKSHVVWKNGIGGR